jgi:hypothetical protein
VEGRGPEEVGDTKTGQADTRFSVDSSNRKEISGIRLSPGKYRALTLTFPLHGHTELNTLFSLGLSIGPSFQPRQVENQTKKRKILVRCCLINYTRRTLFSSGLGFSRGQS